MPRPTPRTFREFKALCRQWPYCPRCRRSFADWLEKRGKPKAAAKLRAKAAELEVRRNRIVMENIGLVGSIIKSLWGLAKVRKRGFELCYSDGQLGLLRAAELYDPSRHVAKFASYAWLAIRREILRYATNDGPVSVPVHENSKRWRQHREAALRPVTSIDGITIDVIADDDDRAGVEVLHLHEALSELPAPQRQAIELHFFSGQTPDQIAAAEGITKQAVSLRKLAALRTLKQRLAA